MKRCQGETRCCSFGCKAQLGGYCSWKSPCLQVYTSSWWKFICWGLTVMWQELQCRIYLTRKAEAAEQCGVEYHQLAFPQSITQKDLIEVASSPVTLWSSSYLLGHRGFEHWSNCSWSYSSTSFTPSHVRKQVWRVRLCLFVIESDQQGLQFCSSWQRCRWVYRGLTGKTGAGT